jgi:regulator of protease activity HflC (stomatin/prohibitin superfamily)
MGYQIMNELITEVNCETGEVIERPRTDQEQQSIDATRAEAQAELRAEAEAEAAKASAEAKLEALGLTADDLKALGL